MKRIIILLVVMVASFGAKAQFPTTDSLKSFINRWIRNSAVEAFQNLRLNTALIGISNFIDSSYGGQVRSFTAPNDSTARLITIGGDTFEVVIRGNPPSISLNNAGSGYRVLKSPNGTFKTLFASYGVTIDSSSNTDGLTFKIDTSSTNHLVTQSDLNDGLATKLNSSDTSNQWINDIRRVPGSTTVEKFKNGSWSTAYTDSVGTGGGGGTAIYSDLGPLSETKIYSPAVGVASSSSVTNYSHTSVDSARYKFSTTRAGSSGSEYGGWLAASTSGDSIKVTAPFWVVIGDSQAEGHPGKHGRLHWLSSGVAQASFKYDYPDSIGQLSYHLRELTNMRWYNHGIGGETTVDVRRRFLRDALGIDVTVDINGRGTRTLLRNPQGVLIIVGINDIFNGVAAQTTKDNLEWMASVCQQEGKRCVILNIPGDAISTQTNLQAIASMNNWLSSGVMDQYGACVVDYNSWWNDPAYGNDNIHHTALITDDIHPSAVGYDSLANYIYRQARLPKLTKALFINELDPGGFTGYSRPAGITINSSPYTISSSTDLINITTYVPDSVWIKVTSSTNVTGTTNSGFSHIEWYTTNNPLDTTYYTKRTLYSGSQKSNVNIGKLSMIAPTSESGYTAIDVTINDMTNKALQLKTSGSGGQLIVNGLSNVSPISSAALSVYKSSGYAIATDGNIQTQGTASQIGQLQITQNSTASTTGYGISTANTSSSMRFQCSPTTNKDQFRFDAWSGGNVLIGSTKTNLIALTNIGFGDASSIDQTANALYINPTYNQTTTSYTNVAINGITYNPIITSLGNARHRGLFILSGNNYINAVSDSSCFGCDSNAVIGAKFRVNGSVRLDLGSDANYDVYYRNSSGLFTRLAAGTDGYVLTTHSTSSAPTWTAPGATVLKGTTNWTPGVVAAGSSTTTTVSVTGAAVGDPVTVSKLSGYSNGEIYDAFVSASNTVTIRVHNVSTGSANYSSAADYNVVVLKY